MDRALRKTIARELRKNQTEVERILWKDLRSRRFEGYKFRRQFPINPYVVDFCCLRHQLIIELDGSQHQDEKERDDARTVHLSTQGYKVLRFWNNQVLEEKEAVLETIWRALQPPSPPPSPKSGEGA